MIDKNIAAVILLLVMVVTIVAVDILFFRHHFLERLLANIGIVLIFIAIYFRLLQH